MKFCALIVLLVFYSQVASARCVNKDPDYCCRKFGGRHCSSPTPSSGGIKKLLTFTFEETAYADSWSDEDEKAEAIIRINRYAKEHCQEVKRVSEYSFSRSCSERRYGAEFVTYCETKVSADYECPNSEGIH